MASPAPVVGVYICPGCGYPVAEGDRYLVAQEYETAAGFGQPNVDPDALVQGAERRFHIGHFHKRIGELVYELIPEKPRE